MNTGIWSEPPRHVLGVPVAVQRFVARGEHAVVVVRSVEAYPTGCLVDVLVLARRGSLPSEVWARVVRDLAPLPPDRLPPRTDLRFGIEAGEGYRGRAFETAGSSGSSDDSYDSEQRLWLSPLPPGPFAFTVEWPGLGLERTALELDGAALARAAEGSEPYWP
ncbi:hypothetical protein ACIRBX_34285 [Kitasatospora sp. NPDC096147]|uniref:hypothetical protein n=1 Tax=Kitasatospora sp. NPDC096147 TaxID=3364093 RepID=UPI00383041D8